MTTERHISEELFGRFFRASVSREEGRQVVRHLVASGGNSPETLEVGKLLTA